MNGSGPRLIGRYLLCDEIACGGMATVHIARLFGEEGFSRIVAVKRLHPQFARDEDFVTMFLNEARLMSRIHHPNVIAPLDVVRADQELFIVMEHVYGESVARLAKTMDRPIPTSIAVGISIQTLLGLHAAHEATDAYGQPLQIVHRDVSPQNILVGADGIARVVDFGIAKAAFSGHTTRDGQLKGKFGYFAPEQLSLASLDRRTDIFTAAIVLWEMLTGRRLFAEGAPTVAAGKILSGRIVPPSEIVRTLPRALDAVVLRGLALSPSDRFQDARSMALELEATVTPASALETGAWVERLAAPTLSRRELLTARLDELSLSDLTLPLRKTDSRVSILNETAFARGTEPHQPRARSAPAQGAGSSTPMARFVERPTPDPLARDPMQPAPQADAQTSETLARSSVSRPVQVRSGGFIKSALPTSLAVPLDDRSSAERRHVTHRRYLWYVALAFVSGAAAMTVVPLVARFSRSSEPSTTPAPTSTQREPSELARPEPSLATISEPIVKALPVTTTEVPPAPSARSVSRLASSRRSVPPPMRTDSSRPSATRRTDASGGSSNCRKAFDDKGHWTLTCSPK